MMHLLVNKWTDSAVFCFCKAFSQGKFRYVWGTLQIVVDIVLYKTFAFSLNLDDIWGMKQTPMLQDHNCYCGNVFICSHRTLQVYLVCLFWICFYPFHFLFFATCRPAWERLMCKHSFRSMQKKSLKMCHGNLSIKIWKLRRMLIT